MTHLWMPETSRPAFAAPPAPVSEDVLRQLERAAYRAGWRRAWEAWQEAQRRIAARWAYFGTVGR